jgi:hypothetical protein
MAIVMDMESYLVARSDAEYGEEVLCSGWNPALALAVPEHVGKAMPATLATADVDAFLRKMYVYQR